MGKKGITIKDPSDTNLFDQLKTSTKTIMVYSNLTFDLFNILYTFPIAPVKIVKSGAGKSTVVTRYGGVFSLQRGNETRGVNTRKGSGKSKKKQSKAIEHFLNQVSIQMSLGNHNVHMMVFSDNVKIAGCRSNEDAITAISIFFTNYLSPISKEKPCFKVKEGHSKPLFLFDSVMKNVDFSLGFDLDRQKVNNLFNREDSKEYVFLSQFESTEQKSVNMKMYSSKPEDFRYTLYSPLDDTLEEVDNNPFHEDTKEQLYDSFLIFSSSKVILSGKYDKNMERSFRHFVNKIMENKDYVMEKIEPVTLKEREDFLSILHEKL